MQLPVNHCPKSSQPLSTRTSAQESGKANVAARSVVKPRARLLPHGGGKLPAAQPSFALLNHLYVINPFADAPFLPSDESVARRFTPTHVRTHLPPSPARIAPQILAPAIALNCGLSTRTRMLISTIIFCSCP